MNVSQHKIQLIGDWLMKIWLDFDVAKTNRLNLDQVTALMKHLNMRLSKTEVKSAFKHSSLGKMDTISFNQFERLYRILRFRPEIASLFSGLHTTNPSIISFDEFHTFLVDTQKVSWDLERCMEIYAKFTSPDTKMMDMDHFSAFLLSSRNAIVKKVHSTVFQDMNQPLSNYYINSSHNTYVN